MWTIGQIIMGMFLALLSAVDIRYRRIPLWLLLAGGLVLSVAGFVNDPDAWWQMILGGAVGSLFLLISYMTREAFGYGDSILIVILGLCLGVWNVIGLLSIAFLCSGFYALLGMGCKKMVRKSSFPFIPFLALGYLCVMLI